MKKVSALLLFVILLGILPSSFAQGTTRPVITPDNGTGVVELIRLGRGPADHVLYSPDGQTIAVAGTVGVWLYSAAALNTPEEPLLIKMPKPTTAMAFSPDGAMLALASDFQLFYWDMASQQITGTYPISNSNAMAFSPDGTLLALNMGYNGISLWDVANGVEKMVLEANLQGDAAVVFSPDGSLITSSTSDYAVHLWRAADASEAATLTGHTGYVYDFAFSPDGSTLATASYDETVRLWDLASSSELAALVGTEEQPLVESYAVAFSPDGAILASGHAEGTIVLWDAASKTLKTRMGSQVGEIRDLDFSPDGTHLVTASTQPAVQIWDVAAGTEIMAAVGHTDYMSTAVFSPDSATLALTDWSNNIWLWDTASLQQLNLVTPVVGTLATSVEDVNLVGYAPDGSLLATSDGFKVALLDPASRTEVRTLGGDIGVIKSFVFSPDSTLLACATSNGMALFNVGTGELLASFTAGDWANSVAFSPDQTMIAIASKDHTVRVYGLPQ